MIRSRTRWVAALAVLGLIATACGGGGDGGTDKAAGGGGATSALPACPIGSIEKATKPVDITYWHAMPRSNEETLKKLADDFNGSQSDVRVGLVNQTSYDDAFNKFKAGLTTGDLPDLVQIEDTGLQQMIDTRAVLPAASCVKATRFDTSDILVRVLDYYSVEDVLWPVPFNVSNPVLYFDKAAFRQAGLDPAAPPRTLDELEAAARKLKAAGYPAGLALKLDPWHLEQWSAKAGVPYVNNGNGRRGRATEVAFATKVGRDVFTWLDRMVTEKLAVTNEAGGQSAFDNLLAVGNRRAAMTIDTSAALGTVTQVLSGGEYAGIELGVAALPGPAGKGGVLVGGAANYIVAKSSPAKQEAAWRFAAFLTEAASQAVWSAGTGYVPIRKSAASLSPLTELWAKEPSYRVAYDQLLAGAANEATAGPVIGDYRGVRSAVIAAEQAMLLQGVAPEQALQQAVQDANEAMAAYNLRVGG